jgi:RHH-type proline utilization regulon transcriptional repressor/proline dehydrogenase/delta 1-pyrroline-5-carboxylate dehydrogenase
MIFENSQTKPDNSPNHSNTGTGPAFEAMNKAYREDETASVMALLPAARFDPEALARIYKTAEQLVLATRRNRKKKPGLDSFLQQYDLSSEEGIALMCLAEALLRIPDNYTADRLISERLSSGDWKKHLTSDNSLFVNAATWSLLLTGKIYAPTLNDTASLRTTLKKYLSKSSATVIRPLILEAMKIMGKQFVMGQTIQEALKRARKLEAKGYRYSYDMLGEAARTARDAEKYFHSYQQAIAAIGNVATASNPHANPGISIKLSALHPRYEYSKRKRVLQELAPRLLALAVQAKEKNIGLTVDAEEADRLELSLEVFARVFADSALTGWEGFGLAVQSYQKRAPYVLDWLAQLSRQYQRRISVRLIKGAYWDSEIKQSQVLGLESYPVFTRKSSTDISFLACAKKIFAHPECFYPQIGTHNAHSVAAIMEIAGDRRDFEFQCLHGMGQTLYDTIVGTGPDAYTCRIYAPVGNHTDLLSYLVRRLLENGANTSFINRLGDEKMPVEKILVDPIARVDALAKKPHPHIPLPADLYGAERKNSRGLDLSNSQTLITLQEKMAQAATQLYTSGPIINGVMSKRDPAPVYSPTQLKKIVGHVSTATASDVMEALNYAAVAAIRWANTAPEERVACLERAADLLEEATPQLMTLLCLEGGKHINDSLSEIREAVDYCRYYAVQARVAFTPRLLSGPTGETNELSLHPRGIIACISPWNFPLAIFLGQVTAALGVGNVVIAKPAEQTPLIAALAIQLLHAAGIPKDVVQLLPGNGETVGAALVADERVAGVMFTGSTATAQRINLTLAQRKGAIVPLIAETGGQNVMIVDSSALPEQVVADILSSAFNSAGQRCSAMRVVFVQEEIAPRLIEMLTGAMAELKIGDPGLLSTDVGPVIDDEALQMLHKHALRMEQEATLLYQVPMPSDVAGHFFAPRVYELNGLGQLTGEVFGPVLHLIRYKANELDKVLQEVNNTGFGLTFGIHSRIEATIKYIKNRVSVGNLYVNRNIIGAVVGVQPFGGEGLSGTGPKAGGPNYLPRLCVERAVSINTTAAGGNTTLVSLKEED